MRRSALSFFLNFDSSDSFNFDRYTVILANGAFPSSSTALQCFFKASRLVCCDGAAGSACARGRFPDYVVGDCDSISNEAKKIIGNRIICVSEQETNDLNKAFRFCLSRNWRDIIILGATGKREDHTLGNISYLVDFAQDAEDIIMATDDGVFYVLLKPEVIKTKPGSLVSIFSFDPNQEITSQGLKYPLNKLRLKRWHAASLNETLGDSFSLQFDPTSPILLFTAFKKLGMKEGVLVDINEWNEEVKAYCKPIDEFERLLIRNYYKDFINKEKSSEERFKAGFKAALLALVDEKGKTFLSEQDEEVIRKASFMPLARVFKVALNLPYNI